jgi:hypothetical protein
MIIFLVILNMWYSTVEIRPMISEFIGSDSRQSTAIFSSSAINLDGNIQDIRIIALCGDATFFDEAFHKISEWLPIWYAGMYRRPEENSTIPQHVWCDNEIERWVVSELKRRQLSIPTSATSIEVIHSSANGNVRGLTLNTTLIGRSHEPAIWVGGMHRPPRRTHFQRFINNWGEVAWSKKMQCSQKDDSKINVYRSRKLWSLAQEENCAVVHLPAILPYANGILEHRIQNGESPANETLSSLFSNKRTREEARQNLESKDKFAVLITLTTFQPRYSTDALVRHALCRLLTKQYKPCIARASWKGQVHNITIEEGFHNTYKGMQNFKFAITMPNHFQDGYIAEKTLHPYLASTVAITAIPNVGQYVNADGMIVCNLSEEELRKVQLYYKGSFHWMPFNTTPEMWQSNDEIKPIKYDPYANNKMGDEPVLEFATSQWEKSLQPCIEEIIRLDQDDDAYIEKLMQPYLLNEGKNSMFDGTYLAMNMLQWFQWANSPLVEGLEDAISELDGMREQTPGWGLPLTNSFDGVDYLSKTKNEEGNHQFLSLRVKGRTTESVLPSRPQPLDNTSCPFCEDNGVPNLELSVPDTGDNTCGSIKSMAAREVSGSAICATLKKEERVCCPVVDSPENNRINNVCHDIKSLRDTTKWPDIIFFEDHPNYVKPANPDPNRKDNMVARATVTEFNRIRNAVLRPTLLDAGIKEGSLYAAQSFAQRFLERKDNSRPLSVAVTGNSFTIGSLCGETDRQDSAACAWPNRLAQRWKEIVTTTFGNSVNSEIEWHMLQQNAQGSNNVMHRLPSLIDEYQSKNKTLDLLLLNNGISDRKGRYGDMGAWFEAVVRVVLEHFPQIVIISIVDGIPEFLDDFNAHDQGFLRSFITTQDHYNLTRIDFAKMCRILRDSDEEKYADLRHQYPQSSLLWPQVSTFMYANGTALTEEVSGFRHRNLHLYWANYTPRVEKTKIAYYPTNHPPWTTHQYVADSILYTLLSLLNSGMGCDGAGSTIQRETKLPLPEATVADKAEVERCTVCLKPRDQLDARTHQVVVNATGTKSNDESPVVVTCGDWKWVTDERKRSGWQSDQAGSLIRFRLKVSGIPYISLTYMTSHATFGSFRVTFQPISKANNTTQLMGCNQTPFPFPSMRLKGKRQQFSLWDTFIFSGKLDSNYGMANKVMKKTVLEMIDQSKDVEYIDMYVLNDNYDGNETRVKIQTVTSCSFHPDKRTELPKADEQCAFCKGGIPTPDMIVPQTGGNTCASIKMLAVKEYNGTDTCKIMQKEESVCCSEPDQSTQLALKAPVGNARSEEDVIVDIAAIRGGNTTVMLNATSNWTTKDTNYSSSTP